TQAPSTEKSHQPPPIPPIPNSPSPIASISSPSNPTSSNSTLDSRQFLKPVAPSKRTLPEKPQNKSWNTSDHENAFLPQELAEIIATRQRRELSTLANFTNEIEKEEVVAFKTYLRQAIANFAAADSHPSPPQVPIHTRPSKGHGKGNDKNPTKKITIATPRIILNKAANQGTYKEVALPKIPQVNGNTWAVVARKGQKKANLVNNTNDTKTRASAGYKNAPRAVNKDNSAPVSDKRLFVRLPHEHEWRKLSPAGVREVVVRKLSISPTLIGKIKPVRSGFALSPCNTEARDKILNAGNGLFLTGAKLEAATNWVPVLIPTVPAFIRKEEGEVEVSNTMLADEVERVCSVRPAHLKLYGGNKAEAPHRTWMAFFSKAPRGSFKVFDESGKARPFKKQQTVNFCNRCNRHHPTKNCSRAPSCGNCGSTNHSEDLCMAATKCRNCGSPHRSDSSRCLARPTHSGAPTKEQIKTYRQTGEREFQALLRAKVAKESAATAEKTNNNMLSSQEIEPDSSNNNSLASSVDNSTDNAIRL
ncbi:hypothetical protein EPUL_006228, partial [Erysiphe pulchra]